MRLLKLILAILLPPLSVLLHTGLSLQLLLSLLLTALGWLPGVIHAFWVLSRAPRVA